MSLSDKASALLQGYYAHHFQYSISQAAHSLVYVYRQSISNKNLPETEYSWLRPIKIHDKCIVPFTFALNLLSKILFMLLMKTQLLLSMPGEMEWVWILLVVVILFGGKKLPELAKGLGKGIHDFKQAKDGIQREIENGINEADVQRKNIENNQSVSPSAMQGIVIDIPAKD